MKEVKFQHILGFHYFRISSVRRTLWWRSRSAMDATGRKDQRAEQFQMIYGMLIPENFPSNFVIKLLGSSLVKGFPEPQSINHTMVDVYV
jgi:hypothetical protein